MRLATFRSLEACVIASQGNLLRLAQVKQAAVRTRQGLQAVRGPCDFIGCLVGNGRMIVFDCKQCGRDSSFDAASKKVSAHQRAQLIRFGEAGAIAGLLTENVSGGRYHWIDWSDLASGAVSFVWEFLPDLGPTTHAIRFDRLIAWYAAREGAAK